MRYYFIIALKNLYYFGINIVDLNFINRNESVIFIGLKCNIILNIYYYQIIFVIINIIIILKIIINNCFNLCEF